MKTSIRSILCSLVVFLVIIGTAQAQSGKKFVFDEKSVLATTNAWAEMMGKADVPALQKLLDDKYMHVHGTARVENKEQFLEAFKSGARRYEPLKLEGVTVRIFNKVAIVNGSFVLKAHVGGKVLEGTNRFGLVIVPTATGNKIVSFQATAIPKQ